MEENKIVTAEEFLLAKDQGDIWCDNDDELLKAFREFAKLHVKAALKAASENVKLSIDTPINKELLDKIMAGDTIKIALVDKDSILNAYPESNIK